MKERIRLLVVDVDGVLTDGKLTYGPSGEEEKTFHVRDGVGLKRLLEHGVEVAVITGRGNAAVMRRMHELGVKRIVTDCRDKGAAVDQMIRELGLSRTEVACMGDDEPDLAMLARAGLAIAVADAHPRVKAAADWVTRTGGGCGALREVSDALIGHGGGFRVIIPARFGAVRFPGKPLKLLAGRPMVVHVWEAAQKSGAAEVIVATDDERIVAAVAEAGGRAELTSPDCVSGTDRLAELARRHRWGADDIVVNLQGDEPLMEPEHVTTVARALAATPAAGIATAAVLITDVREVFDPNIVKVVLDDAGLASYFSRAPIPFVRGLFPGGGVPTNAADPASTAPITLPPNVPFLRHLGLYAYRVSVLEQVAIAPPCATERAESLEQLRALALGIRIHVTVVAQARGAGVDTPDDLARMERLLSEAAPARR